MAGPQPGDINPIIRWAFLAFILSLYIELDDDKPFPFQPPTLLAAVFVLTAFLQWRFCFQRPPLACWWFVTYLGMFIASFVLHGVDHVPLFAYWLAHSVLLVALLLPASQLMRHDAVAKEAMGAFTLATLVISALMVSGVLRTPYRMSNRETVLGQNPANLASLLALGMLALIGLFLGPGKLLARFRYLAWPLVALIGLAIIPTGSRGPLVALGMGLLAFTLRPGSYWVKLRNTALIATIVGTLVYLSSRSDMLVHRLEESAEGKWSIRETLYPTAWQMFQEAPLFGWGPVRNDFEIQARVQYPEREWLDSHNFVLEVLTGTGLLGAVPLLVGTLLCLRAAWRARHGSDRMLPLALLITAVMVNMSIDWMYSKTYWFVLAYALARGNPFPPSTVARSTQRPPSSRQSGAPQPRSQPASG